jgi:hypothetical protein
MNGDRLHVSFSFSFFITQRKPMQGRGSYRMRIHRILSPLIRERS